MYINSHLVDIKCFQLLPCLTQDETWCVYQHYVNILLLRTVAFMICSDCSLRYTQNMRGGQNYCFYFMQYLREAVIKNNRSTFWIVTKWIFGHIIVIFDFFIMVKIAYIVYIKNNTAIYYIQTSYKLITWNKPERYIIILRMQYSWTC